MKRLLSIIMAGSLLLYPFAAFAEDYGSQMSQVQQIPPVAQALVREGDFAIKLTAKLNLGSPKNETEAEDILAKAGVVPLNGWLSDYPVTPEIIGQLQSAIARSASEGSVPVTSEVALQGLYSLTQEMNLPTPAVEGSVPSDAAKGPPAGSTSTEINNYYYDQGPPVVTYYPPPADYVYLYDWVPYPVVWFGFWFPGFFICHHFTSVVVFRSFDNDDHHEHWRRGLVTNRVMDPVTRRVATVDPVTRTTAGTVRPVTTLHTENGNTFKTLTEMRAWSGSANIHAAESGSSVRGISGTGGFSSIEARKSAETIYSNSLARMRTNVTRQGSMMRGAERQNGVSGAPGDGRSFNTVPSRSRENGVITPGMPRTNYQPSMNKENGGIIRPNVASVERGRGYITPAPREESQVSSQGNPARSFSSPVIRRSAVGSRTFTDGEWGWPSSGGRSFSGGMCRGRC